MCECVAAVARWHFSLISNSICLLTVDSPCTIHHVYRVSDLLHASPDKWISRKNRRILLRIFLYFIALLVADSIYCVPLLLCGIVYELGRAHYIWLVCDGMCHVPSRILTANFILFVANKVLCGPWNVCSVVDDSASHTQSDPSRSADMMRRESINTVTQLIAALCPYQRLIGVKFYDIFVNLHTLWPYGTWDGPFPCTHIAHTYLERCDYQTEHQIPHDHNFIFAARSNKFAIRRETDTCNQRRMIIKGLRQLRRIYLPNLYGSTGCDGRQLWIAWYVKARGRLCVGRSEQGPLW